MSLTTKWSIDKPIEGSLNWDVPIRANYDLIDSILYKLRTNYAGTTEPTENADTGSLWYDSNITEDVLKVKKIDGGYSSLLDELYADSKYVKLNGSVFIGTHLFSDAILHWNDSTNGDFAKIIFQSFNTHKNLVFEFGGTPSLDAIRFNWNTGESDNIFHIFSDKVKSFKPIEIPEGTASNHAINKLQADLAYAPLNHNHEVYALKAGSFSQTFNVKDSQQGTYNAIPRNQGDLLYSGIGHNHNSEYALVSHIHPSEFQPLSKFINGTLTQNTILHAYIAIKPFIIPANLLGTKAVALIPALSTSTTITISKSSDNGNSFLNIGSITFTPNNKVATLNTSSQTTINTGDIIKISTGATIDTSLSNIILNIAIQ